MKTAIIQSAAPRRHDWVDTCLASVRSWAENRFDYFFEGDELFARVAPAHREALLKHRDMAPLSDLARLMWAKELLEKGYQRVVWLDSDVFIFDPERFTTDLPTETSFCQETWYAWGLFGVNQYRFAVNNAVMVLCDSPEFKRYLDDAIQRVEQGRSRTRLSIGPELLSALHFERSLRLIRHVPTLASDVQQSFIEGTAICRDMMKWHGHRATAVHLCVSHAGTHDLVRGAIAKVAADRGAELNASVEGIATSYFDRLPPYSQVRMSGRILFAVASWARSIIANGRSRA